MSAILFEKSKYPIDTNGRYGCLVKIDGEYFQGILNGTQFTYMKPNAFSNTVIDLAGATETPGLEAETEEIAAHNQKMQSWRDSD